LFESVDAVREAMNVSFLIVEQNVKQGLNVSDRAYVMKTGRVVLEEDSRVLLERGEWWDLF
jgi:branched-chain amino acid transport system ATP-binding protein